MGHNPQKGPDNVVKSVKKPSVCKRAIKGIEPEVAKKAMKINKEVFICTMLKMGV